VLCVASDGVWDVRTFDESMAELLAAAGGVAAEAAAAANAAVLLSNATVILSPHSSLTCSDSNLNGSGM